MGLTRKAGRRLSELDKLLIVRRSQRGLLTRAQYGGARRYGVVSANGFKYNYMEDTDSDTISIHAGMPRRKSECFLLLLEPDQTASLQSMKQSPDCSLTDGATSHNLVHAAFALAKEKGAHRIFLTDEATKHLPNGKHFRLSDMYFLATGQTWYEHVAAVKPVAADEATIQRWRERVLTNRWNDVFACLTTEFPALVIPVDTADIDGGGAGSAMTVFRRIKEARTDFFADYWLDLLRCCGIGPIERITWFADL